MGHAASILVKKVTNSYKDLGEKSEGKICSMFRVTISCNIF